jgi:hypothetical protein
LTLAFQWVTLSIPRSISENPTRPDYRSKPSKNSS